MPSTSEMASLIDALVEILVADYLEERKSELRRIFGDGRNSRETGSLTERNQD